EIGPGGQQRIFWAPWNMNISPLTMRSSANACGEKRPITSGIQHLVCETLSCPAPASTGAGPTFAMRNALLILILIAAACRQQPVQTSTTDTVRPSTTGTTATETGGGAPVTSSTS